MICGMLLFRRRKCLRARPKPLFELRLDGCDWNALAVCISGIAFLDSSNVNATRQCMLLSLSCCTVVDSHNKSLLLMDWKLTIDE